MGWLDMIILFCCCIIEVFILYDYFKNFFDIKVKRRYIKIICAGTVGVIYCVNILQNNLLNLVLIPVVLWIFVTLLFDAKLGFRFVYFSIAYIVMIAAEFLYIILSNTTTVLLEKTGLIPVSEYFWQLLFIKFLNYIIFIILKQMSVKSKNKITNKLFWIYLCVPLSTLGTMLIIFYSGVDVGSNSVLKMLMTLFFVFMITGNMLLFYAFQKYAENLCENSMQQLEIIYQKAEVERLTKIAEWNDNYNEIIHNISNYLKVIGQLAYEQKYEEICKVVEKINGQLNREDIIEFSNHKMLNVILSEYSYKAEKAGVSFDVYVEPGCILEHIPDIDLLTMLSNLLDNAILATSQEGNGSTIVVRIFMQKNGKMCIIKVVNDYQGDIKESNGKLISTKKDAGVHGIGLVSVSKIAERNSGYFEYYLCDKKFNAVIVLSI